MQSRVEQLEDRRLLTAALMTPIDVVTPADGSDAGTAPVQADPAPVDDGTAQGDPVLGDPVLLADPVFIATPAPQPVDPVVDPSFAAPTVSENADGSVQLSWQGVDGAQSYSVQRSDAGGDFYDVYADISDSTAIDSTVQPGMQYAYRIVANPDGDSPAASGSASIVTSGVAAPDSLNVSSSDTQVDLQWSWGGASQGVSYTLQRALVDADGNDGEFQTIATGLTGIQFSDTSITPGANYDYQVIAVAQGQQSAPSYSAYVQALGQLNVTSTTIDSHVDVGQAATLKLTYDVAPGGGHPSTISVYWGDGTWSDISDPTTAGDIQTSLSADGTQMTITATHQYTDNNTANVSIYVQDGSKVTTQDATVVVGTGEGQVVEPIYYGGVADGGVYLASGVTARGDSPSVLANGATNSTNAQAAAMPVFATREGDFANSPFAAGGPAVFDMSGARGIFDVTQAQPAEPSTSAQPFGTVIIPATETRTEKTQEDNLDFLDASAPTTPADTQTAADQPAAQPPAPTPVQAAPPPVVAPAPGPQTAAPADARQPSNAQPTTPIRTESRQADRPTIPAPAKASLAPAGVALLLAQRFHRPSADARKRSRKSR